MSRCVHSSPCRCVARSGALQATYSGLEAHILSTTRRWGAQDLWRRVIHAHSQPQLTMCAVTPVFRIRLEDVLNRRHLPPLGA